MTMAKKGSASAQKANQSVSAVKESAPAQPTSYRLKFLPKAKEEWDKLDGSLQLQFSKAIAKRLAAPRVAKAALASMPDCYKIKLRSVGYRLVYKVIDAQLILLTVAVGKRDKSAVYLAAQTRLAN
jgi:mRNA interferase RelE/StbE